MDQICVEITPVRGSLLNVESIAQGDQILVRPRQGALPRIEEERRAVARAVQPVDDAGQCDGSAGISAPAISQGARKQAERDRETSNQRPDLAHRLESAASACSQLMKADLPLAVYAAVRDFGLQQRDAQRNRPAEPGARVAGHHDGPRHDGKAAANEGGRGVLEAIDRLELSTVLATWMPRAATKRRCAQADPPGQACNRGLNAA